MNNVNKKIRIAIQSSGRLMEPSLDYLKSCGLSFCLEDRSLIVVCDNFDIEIVFVRSSDIPEYLSFGVVDYGIVGENLLMERELKFEVVKKLDFGKCSLAIAIPQNSKINSIDALEHERIATSYPRILKSFLKKAGVNSSIIDICGSVEVCPLLGLSDAIFDIVQTGETLRKNGLKVLEKILDSQAVLIKNANFKSKYENIFL